MILTIQLPDLPGAAALRTALCTLTRASVPKRGADATRSPLRALDPHLLRDIGIDPRSAAALVASVGARAVP